MIDSENNILDSNKLYYYNIIQGQPANAYQPYAYISQPSPISNTISPMSSVSQMSSVSPMNPVSSVTVNQVGQGTEMATETVAKSDNARVKRAKQRIRQQIYVGKIVSVFNELESKTIFCPNRIRVKINFESETTFGPIRISR